MSQKKIPQKVKRAILEYLQALRADHLPITKVYLFGSYATGKAHEFSDIDLCILSPKFQDPWDALQYLWSKRTRDIGLTIEPVGFSSADFKENTSLISEIKRTGIQIPLNS